MADSPGAAAPVRLGAALLSCVLKPGLLLQRSSDAANEGAQFFASFGHATWGGLGWPLLRKGASPETVHFEFDPAGHAEWLHVVELGK